MNNKSFIKQLCAVMSTLCRFGTAHKDSREAMTGTYSLQHGKSELLSCQHFTTLKIEPHGSIFRVISREYTPVGIREDSWLATYVWHCNGHLIAIGDHIYWIMDPAQQKIYVERYDDNHDKIIETYERV